MCAKTRFSQWPNFRVFQQYPSTPAVRFAQIAVIARGLAERLNFDSVLPLKIGPANGGKHEKTVFGSRRVLRQERPRRSDPRTNDQDGSLRAWLEGKAPLDLLSLFLSRFAHIAKVEQGQTRQHCQIT